MKLTIKQQRFADEYIISGNATEAYKLAYPNIKKDETARANGSRMLTNANVSEYIANRLEELQSDKIANQQEVMEYLTAVMRREKKEVVVVTLTKEESKWVDGKKQTTKTEEPRLVEIPAKLSDANKAAELLGKRYKLWTDKQEITERTFEIVIGGDNDENED